MPTQIFSFFNALHRALINNACILILHDHKHQNHTLG